MPADPKGVRPNCEANEKGGSKAAPSLAVQSRHFLERVDCESLRL